MDASRPSPLTTSYRQPAGCVPEQLVEAVSRAFRQLPVMRALGLEPESAGQVLHHAQRVVPERLDLHRLAGPRRHHPVAHLGIHPGELHARLAGAQQAVRIHADSVARAALVPGDDVRAARRRGGCGRNRSRPCTRPRLERLRRTTASRRRCCIRASRPRSGKAIRQHALVDVGGEGQQDAFGDVVAPGREREARAARSWCRGPNR